MELTAIDCFDVASVVRRLDSSGITLLSGITSRDTMLATIHQLGTTWPHPDADSDGITCIHDRGLRDAGARGFSDEMLDLHTDRSTENLPPALLMMWFEHPAHSGGDSVFCNGQRAYTDIATMHPGHLEILSSPEFEFAGIRRPIFEVGPHRTFIRYRTDNLVRPSDRAQAAWVTLHQRLRMHSEQFLVAAGLACVLNNGWLLHGRTPFTGPRKVLRALIAPNASSSLQLGFVTSTHTPLGDS